MDKLTVVKKNSKCNFCGLSKNDFFRYGAMYKLGNIIAHYYCVLLSSRLTQKGKDDEGLLGFLYHDIQEELKRTSNILCFYCKRGNASIRCAYKKCRRNFHLPCGLKNGSLNQFIDDFKSFCHLHCPVQNIPKDILEEAYKTEPTCCICYEKLYIKKMKDILWAPCCLKSWYHMYCVQKLACSAGYFFRCPACNDVKKFNKWVQKFGIFIPQQDASWELVPNAFEELLFKYNRCDAKVCLCPYGREEDREDQMWEIILCASCGSQGTHATCGRLEPSCLEWECSECQKVTKSIKFATKTNECKAVEGSSSKLKIAEIRQKKRCRGSEDFENLILDKRKKCKEDVQEEEIEIDVETVDGETKDDETKRTIQGSKDTSERLNGETAETKKIDPQEALTLIKPGPLSYKLGLIRKALKNSRSLPVTTIEEKKDSDSEKSTNLIVLTDSGDEREAKTNIEVNEAVGKQTTEKHITLISPSKMNKVAVESSRNERDNYFSVVAFLNDFSKVQEESSFSLNDFDILAVMTFHTSRDQKRIDKTVDSLNESTEKAASMQGPELARYVSVYPLTQFKIIP